MLSVTSLLFTHHYPARCFGINMSKSRDIQAKIHSKCASHFFYLTKLGCYVNIHKCVTKRKMNNKIKTILMAAIMSSVVLTQGVCVSAAQFDDGASAFSDGTGSVSALASTLAKQTEEQTQEFVAKEEEAAQIREERRVEKAEKASEKAEQEKTAALESIQQTVEDTKKKIAEEAEAKRLAKRQEVVNFALQFEGNPYVYGGTSLTNGADCSGFVMSVFANFGYSLPRVAAAQCDASTKKDISQLEPGDLVFYGSGYIDHVALYIGDGKIIHASNAATGIKISDYDYEQPAAVGTFME